MVETLVYSQHDSIQNHFPERKTGYPIMTLYICSASQGYHVGFLLSTVAFSHSTLNPYLYK